VSAEQCELQFSVGGVVFRAAGGKRCPIPCEGQGVDGKEHEEVIFAQGKDDGAFVALEADGDRFSLASLLQGTYPRLNGFWCMVETAVLSLLGARNLSANIVFGIGPVEADAGRKGFVGFVLHMGSPSVWCSGAKGHASLCSAKAL